MVSLDGLEGPGNYALNRRAVLTLVMVRDGRVHSSHAFTDSGEHDLPFLEQLIDEITGPVPKGDKALRLLRKTRLPKEVGQLRRLTVRYLAFEGQGMLQSHPMLSIVEEITGPLPKPDMALREIVESRMPPPPATAANGTSAGGGIVSFKDSAKRSQVRPPEIHHHENSATPSCHEHEARKNPARRRCK